MSAGTRYLVAFDRIGRNRDVRAVEFDADSPDDLARQIREYARPHLIAQDVEVEVNVDTGRGQIFAGPHHGGNFTVAVVPLGDLAGGVR
jgi:hypothetical protein